MPLPAEYLRCFFCQKQIISQQAVQKVVYRGQSLHRLGKAGMNGISRFFGTIPQLPDAKMAEIFPQNRNAEPLPVPGRLCMVGEQKQFCFRVNSKVSFQFLRSGVGRKPKEAGGKVNDITGGVTAEAVEIILIQLHAGVPVLVKWAAGHAVSQYPQSVGFGSLPQWDSCLYTFKLVHFLIS